MSSRRSPILRLLAAVGASVVGFGLVGFGLLGFMEGTDLAIERLADVDFAWATAAVAVWALSAFVQGFRLRALLPVRQRPSGPAAAWLLLGGNALNLSLPGPVGELACAWFLRRRHGVPMPAALAAGMLGRAVALVVFGVTTMLAWPLVEGSLPPPLDAALGPVAVGTGLVTLPLVALCARPGWLLGLASSVLDRLAAVPRLAGPVARVAGRLRWWARCFAAVGSVPVARWAEAAGWSFLNLCILTASTLLTLRAAGIPAFPFGTFFMQAMTAVASVAGMLVPGGFGAVEVLVVGLFPVFATGDTADAVFAAVALRAVHLFTLLLGVPAMAWLLATLPGAPEAVQADLEDELEREMGEPGDAVVGR